MTNNYAIGVATGMAINNNNHRDCIIQQNKIYCEEVDWSKKEVAGVLIFMVVAVAYLALFVYLDTECYFDTGKLIFIMFGLPTIALIMWLLTS